MREIVIASGNKGKIKEAQEILKEFKVISMNELGIDIDVEEDQDTFLGNAKKKAFEIYNLTKEATIADDSGLCIKALDGFPGVMTHRFLGNEATDEERNEYLINEVNKCNSREAQVVCELVYYDGSEYIVGEGILDGFISTNRRGNNGFGFDEIFELPNGFTLAEVTPLEKNQVSARALAAKDLQKKLGARFGTR